MRFTNPEETTQRTATTTGNFTPNVRLHVRVPGWLLNLNALLTKKSPKFLSRLNEMSGGRENMCLV